MSFTQKFFPLICFILFRSSFAAAQIEPTNQDQALQLAKAAYAYLADSQRRPLGIGRRAPERAACATLGRFAQLYSTEQKQIIQGNKEIMISVFANPNINVIIRFCDPSSVYQRVNAMMALHDEIVRLYENKLSTLTKPRELEVIENAIID